MAILSDGLTTLHASHTGGFRRRPSCAGAACAAIDAVARSCACEDPANGPRQPVPLPRQGGLPRLEASTEPLLSAVADARRHRDHKNRTSTKTALDQSPIDEDAVFRGQAASCLGAGGSMTR